MIINLWSTSLGGGFEGSYTVNLGSFGTVTVVAPFTTLVTSTGESMPGYLIEDPTETVHNITSQYSTYVAYNLPNAKTVPSSAFLSFNNIMSVNLSQVETIGTDAFRDALGLQYVGNLANVRNIHSSAFKGATALTGSLSMSYLSSLGAQAFANTKITGVNAPLLTSLLAGVFNNCKSIAYASFPKLTTLASDAFYESPISSGNFKSVRSFYSYCLAKAPIPDSAFNLSNIHRLESGALGQTYFEDSSIYLGGADFSYITFNQNFKNSRNSIVKHITVENRGITNSQINVVGNFSTTGFSNLETLEIKDNYTSDSALKFSSCHFFKYLKDSYIGRDIYSYQFYDCNNLIFSDYLQNVHSVGSSAFQNCSNLSKIELAIYGNSVSKYYDVNASAFANCINLSTIFIDILNNASSHKYPVYINNTAFTNCPKLSNIVISGTYYSSLLTSYVISLPNISNCTYWVKSTIFDKMPTTIKSKISYNSFADIYSTVLGYSDKEYKYTENSYYFFSSSINEYYKYLSNNIAYYGYDNSNISTLSLNNFLSKTEFLAGINDMETEVPDSFMESNSYIVNLTCGGNKSIFARIGSSAFKDCINLTISEIYGLGTIGAKAFFNCQSISQLSLLRIDTIEDHAFANCINLSSLNINFVDSISNTAFSNCNTLQRLTLKGNIFNNNIAFSSYSMLSSVYINDYMPDSTIDVVSIPNYFLANNSVLTYVFLSQSISRPIDVGNYAFANCIILASISSYYTTGNFRNYGDYAFYNCKALSRIATIATKIGSHAFDGTGLISINGFTSKYNNNISYFYSDYAFANLSLTSSLYIDGNLNIASTAFDNSLSQISYINLAFGINTNLNGMVFNDTPNLTSVYVYGTKIPSKIFQSNSANFSLTLYAGSTSSAYCTLGLSAFENTGVTSISCNQWAAPVFYESYCFANCSNLTALSLHKTFQIAPFAFYNCSNLSVISLSTSSEVCPNLTIEQYAFSGCYNINSISIGKDYYGYKNIEIHSQAFESNVDLTLYSKYIRDENNLWSIPELTITSYQDSSGIKHNEATIETSKYPNVNAASIITYPSQGTNNYGSIVSYDRIYGNVHNRHVQQVILPDNIGILSIAGFDNNVNLSMINLPNTITTIENAAFKNCYTLSEITLPSNLSYIQSKAFQNCLNLKTITNMEIFYSLSTIDDYAFQNTGIRISNGVFNNLHTLGHCALPGGTITSFIAPNLSRLTYDILGNIDKTQISYISVSSIIAQYYIPSCFSNCPTLAYIAPMTLTPSSSTGTIIIDSSAFANCSKLENFPINLDAAQYSTLYFNSDCFFNCKNISFPSVFSSVRLKSASQFQSCTQITELTFDHFLGMASNPWDSTARYTFRDCSSLTKLTFNYVSELESAWNTFSLGILPHRQSVNVVLNTPGGVLNYISYSAYEHLYVSIGVLSSQYNDYITKYSSFSSKFYSF